MFFFLTNFIIYYRNLSMPSTYCFTGFYQRTPASFSCNLLRPVQFCSFIHVLKGMILQQGREAMSYYMSITLQQPFDQCLERVTGALQAEGFGVLTHIDVKETMKKKLDVDFRNYHILGACNPPFAHKALVAEDKIGTMLPCNVIVQETAPGTVEVAAVDPVSSMQAVHNEALQPVAEEIRGRLKRMIDSLQSGKGTP